MNDYRLQLPDEATWWTAADACGWVKYEYEPQTVELGQEPAEPVVKRKWLDTNGKDFDVIGTIYKPTGNMLQQGDMQAPEMAAIAGHHVNVRLHYSELPESLRQYVVIPNNPVRGWAGGWYEGM
jgi:hypothetical protein